MTIRDWLGENNTLGVDIWERKYRDGNEDFDAWIDRISNGDKSVKQLILDKKFLFGGRILANRGLANKGKKITYSNCYVTSTGDSIEEIFECAQKLARTYSYGGGVGVDISSLSPRGAKIHNAAKETSGAVSFMDLYALVTGLIGQGGRRGALMISMSCNHPDLEEFIDVKSDLNKVNQANISIRLTDEFMQAVENNEDYTLSFTRSETGETISKVVNARNIFRKIATNNWDMGEPGALFWDRIESWNLLANTKEFKFEGVNPCFTGDMQLLTVDGYKTFDELCGTTPLIYNIIGNVCKSKVWCSGEKDTVSVNLADGRKITCTPDHKFMAINGDEVYAKDLKGQYLMPLSTIHRNDLDKKYIKYGFIQGDGTLGSLSSTCQNTLEVNIGYKDTDILDLFSDEIHSKSDRAIYVSGLKNELNELGFSSNNLPERDFPSTYKNWTQIQKASFLQGCYSANGSVIKQGRISYKTTCRSFAENLLSSLSKDFGIRGYITTNKAKEVEFHNGKYQCRESYDINISTYESKIKFVSEINFYQQYKREHLSQMLKFKPTYVYSVETNGIQKVYDFTEPETHWGVVNGYIVHNCAEEPLPAGGSCLLGSLNLSAFVENGTFQEEAFCEAVSIAVRALNDVLDEGMPLHPLQEQRDSVRDWRQIGLGVMGIADMLIKLGYKYGGSDSIQICDNIAGLMADIALYTSCMLAQNSGTYPKYDKSAVMSTKYFKKNAAQSTYDYVEKYGLRNSQILTIAPTGSLSTMIGVSGGIEPIFANYYERKTESLHGKDVFYKVYTPIVEDYMKVHNILDDKDLPDFFVTAQTLDYIDRISMQSVWQTHIDASISSTVNVPNNFTVEDTEELYMEAWRRGLKGITIFRDGCKRAGVLLTTPHKEEIATEPIQERGYVIKVSNDVIGKKRRLITGCGSLHVSAFFDPITGDLLETYLNKGSSGGCNQFMIGLSRMMSIAARSGCPIEAIIDQLNSCGTCPSYAVRAATKHDTSKGACCPSAIGNALVSMWNEVKEELDIEDTKPENKNVSSCPECGEPLNFEGGCNICKSCGWTRCD